MEVWDMAETVLPSQVIDGLIRFRSPDAPVLSMYLTVPADPGEVKGARSQLRTLAKVATEHVESDQLGHAERESLKSDIGHMLALEGDLPAMKGRGVALFSCTRHKLLEQVVLPRPVKDRVDVDVAPYVRPLLGLASESPRYCVVVIDRANVWLYLFHLGSLEEAKRDRDRTLRNKDHGGPSGYDEYTVHNKSEDLARRHFRHAVEETEAFMQDQRAELLIVGGHEDVVTQFLGYFPEPLADKRAGTFVIDPHTMTPARIRDHAEQVVDDYEHYREQQLVSEAIDRAKSGGLGALGLDWCLLAGDEQAVEQLLIDQDAEVGGQVCDNCGWLGLSGQSCPVCGQSTRRSSDIIGNLAVAVVGASGTVTQVAADHLLAEELVAAFLRFPVPPPQD
jgi:peptide chain release factor subunit 1